MSKNSQKSFDRGFLSINKEIDEQVGKIKNSNYPYARISKNKTNKNERNKSGQKKLNSSLGENYYDKKSSKDNYISNTSSHKRTGNMNVFRTKVIKKKNFDHVERVVIDLVNSEDVESINTGSNVTNNNIYENENNKGRYNNEYNEYINNKDNNINYNLSNILIALNMIESRWKNNCSISKEKDMNYICNEIDRNKREIEILLNRWNNKTKIIKEDKLSIFSSNNNINSKNNINYNINIINKWKQNNKNIKEINLNYIINNIVKNDKIILKANNSKNHNNYKMIKTERLSFFIDNLKIKEKEMNNFINRWLNNNKSIFNGNISYLVDEIEKKKKEIERNIIKWNNNNKSINSENISYLIDKSLINAKNIKNRIDTWNNNNKSTSLQNISYQVDKLLINSKKIKDRITQWNNNNKLINSQTISYLIDKSLIITKNNKERIIQWNNNNKSINSQNISYLIDKSLIKSKNIKNIIDKWNNENKSINTENISFFIDIQKIKEKELTKWLNNIDKHNNISLSYNIIQDINSFKYSEEEYINDLIENIYISENNKNNFFILNYDSNSNPDNYKINYKIIKPNNKNQFQSIIYNFYKENKNIDIPNNNLNKDNNLSQILQNKNSHLTPIFILNDEQIKQLYEEFNKEKFWKDELIISEKQIELCYEIIEPYLTIESNNSKIKFEKRNEFILKGTKKLCEDFGETTPLYMLNDKFYVFAVSRNIKYSIQSPQPNLNYINNKNDNVLRSKKGFNTINGFNRDKIKINHFSLWIERIDRLESNRSNK